MLIAMIIEKNMNETEELVKRIAEGIQEKKGKKIVIADLTGIDDTICKYFVICQGDSPSQLSAITDSIWDYVHQETRQKPTAIDGLRNTQWIAMDYSDVMVHIFLPEAREFYNLENLWADAKLINIPDID
jgi:ribosome-associated protein